MPLFEYKCGKCGHAFEFLARSSEDAPRKCPQCGSSSIQRQFSTFSARVDSAGGSSCSDGSCSLGSCPTGTCPLS